MVDVAPETRAPEGRGACLESFRIDMTSRIWPFLVPAACLISLGSLGVCMAFVTHGPLASHAGTITLLGGACMLAGLLLAILVARTVLMHDEYLAALERGLLWKLDGEEKYAAWDEIADVRWDDGRATVVIRLREGEPILVARPFARGPGNEVATRLDEIRRKVGFHLRQV